MQTKCLLLAAVCLLMTGCQPVDCLNPLYTDKDIISDSSLVGDWFSTDPDNQSVTRITESVDPRSKLTSYDIKMIEKDDMLDFHAYLVNLGGQHFLDVVPQSWDTSSASYQLHVTQSKDALNVEPRLLRLGMAAYMELTSHKAGTIQAQLKTAHWFIKVTRDGKTLRFDYSDDTKLAKAIAAGDLHISHSLLGEGKSKDIVITAGTQELQKFVLEHKDDQRVFTEHSDTVVRRP